MAAQKLTKARLIQILVLLAVLITAFIWRTITYKEGVLSEEVSAQCQTTSGECFDTTSNREIKIRLIQYAGEGGNQYQLQLPMDFVASQIALISPIGSEQRTPINLIVTKYFITGDFSLPDDSSRSDGWTLRVELNDVVYILKF